MATTEQQTFNISAQICVETVKANDLDMEIAKYIGNIIDKVSNKLSILDTQESVTIEETSINCSYKYLNGVCELNGTVAFSYSY